MELKYLEQRIEVLIGLSHAQIGMQEARQTLFEATLIALHRRDPELLAEIQQQFEGYAPVVRAKVHPEAQSAYDSTTENLLRSLGAIQTI